MGQGVSVLVTVGKGFGFGYYQFFWYLWQVFWSRNLRPTNLWSKSLQKLFTTQTAHRGRLLTLRGPNSQTSPIPPITSRKVPQSQLQVNKKNINPLNFIRHPTRTRQRPTVKWITWDWTHQTPRNIKEDWVGKFWLVWRRVRQLFDS
jgi:hypothetical protein